MGLTINTNVQALNASRNLNNTENMLSAAMRHLSSGLRINSAADDVAGYAISQRLQAQVNGLNQATLNSQDAVSLSQTGQGLDHKIFFGAEVIEQHARARPHRLR